MKILKLNLKGFIGISKGLNTEQIELDFSNLSGLIALAGPNGNGKSTVLENLHPYRTLASRNGSLKKHVFLRDSFRDLEFMFGGRHYRSLIKIDCDSDRAEAFLWENGHPLVDGKVSNYDTAIVEKFGTTELFFNSVFCAQNGKKLSDLTTGELKKLFGEFLRLDRYNRWEDTCKKAITIIGTSQAGVDDRIKELVRETNEKDSILAAMVKATSEKDSAGRSANYARGKLVTLEAEHREASDIAVKNAVLEEQIAGHKKQIESIQKAVTDEKARVNSELEGQRIQYRKITGEIKDLQETLSSRFGVEYAAMREVQATSDLSDLRNSIYTSDMQLSSLLSKEKTISAQLSKKEREKIGIDNDKVLSTLDSDIADLKRRVEDIDKQLADLPGDNQLYILENKLASSRKQKENLAGLIDDPHCRDKKCRFISDAMESEKEIPDLEKAICEKKQHLESLAKELKATKLHFGKKSAELAEKRNKIANSKLNKVIAVNEEIEKLSVALDQSRLDIEAETEKRKMIREKIQALETCLSEFRARALKLSDLSVAASKIDGLKERLAEIAADGIKVRGCMVDFEKARLKEIGDIRKLISSLENRIDPNAAEKAGRLKMEIDELKTEAEKAEKEAAVLEERIKSFKKELHQKQQAEKKFQELRNHKKLLISESSDWAYLRDACGKNGLQALEIDSVAPGIAAYANGLLEKTFGPNFTVSFKTQDELTGREILDIIVIDGNGDEVILDNLSGGQKVWILMALRLAMVLIAKEKSGRIFESVMADELDGALDPENAQNFISLYQAFMAAGGFRDCFFISHRPECVSMADHVIGFSKSGISIN